MAFITCFITLILGYPFAYFVANIKSRFRLLVLLLVMIPFWTSSLLRTYGLKVLLNTNGVINSLLLWLGAIDSPIKFMNTRFAVMVGMVYMLLPLMIFPVYNAIAKLDRSLIEASYDLNAGKFVTFAKITLPLTLSGIIGGLTLVFIPAVGLFFISDLLGGSTVMLIGNLINNQINSARNWPFGAALAVVLLLITLGMVFAYSRTSKNMEDIL